MRAGLWLFFLILWPLIALGDHHRLHAGASSGSIDETLALEQFSLVLARLSPDTLFGEAVIGLLNPETKAFGDFANLVMRRPAA